MRINFKKLVTEKIEPLVSENGFRFYQPLSKQSAFFFVKFAGPEPNPEWVKKLGKEMAPLYESIGIYKSLHLPKITVDFYSGAKRDMTRLGFLEYNFDHWWPISTQEEAEQSIGEIVRLLNKHAWDWFAL